MIETARIADVMGLANEIRSLHDLRAAVDRGLPKKTIRAVISRVLPDCAEQTAVIYNIIPAATYKRRKRNLSPEESARTERLARVIATAEFVWDEYEDARLFLISSHPALGDERPMDAARSEIGARQVEELLWKLYHGLPA